VIKSNWSNSMAVLFAYLLHKALMSAVFWNVVPHISKRARRFGETLNLQPAFPGSFLAHYWTPKMEAICPSQTCQDSCNTANIQTTYLRNKNIDCYRCSNRLRNKILSDGARSFPNPHLFLLQSEEVGKNACQTEI
jgi:hypothetical protein